MRRDLPPRASLEHLKKQAKDLLDAHKRADPDALARIRASVPAYAGLSVDAVAAAPFALHDAQSAIAREYGKASWAELRDAVAAQGADAGPSEALLRALIPLPFPAEAGALIRDLAAKRTPAATAAKKPLPEVLPALTMRNAVFLPRALGPIHLARPTSLATLAVALDRAPPTLAVFAQRTADEEAPDAAGLHPVGCEAYVHARVMDGDDRAWVVLEGVRSIALVSLEPGPRGSLAARVKEVTVEEGDAAEVEPLAASLRAHARNLASAFPDGARLVALIDAADPERLADLVVANLPVSVDDKARYASAPSLPERLRIACALSGAKPAP